MNLAAPITLGILEDDEATRSYLEAHLSAQPDFTLSFSCGLLADALAALDRRAPDIVLVDIRLPDGTGLDFVRAFRALGRFRGQSSFSTWLYRIGVNVCLNRVSLKAPPVEPPLL